MPQLLPLLNPAPSLHLTPEESQWLEAHRARIRVGVSPHWGPYEFIDKKGEYKGYAAEYLSLIEEMLDIEVQLVQEALWYTTLEKAKNREIDLLLSTTSTPERRKFLLFTPPYYTAPYHIITRKSNEAIQSVGDLSGKTLAYTKGYAIDFFKSQSARNIQLVPVDSDHMAIRKVAFGEVDAMLGCLATTLHAVEQEGITGLKEIGYSGFSPSHCMASRSDWPLFSQILTKALAAIDAEKHAEIHKKWITIESPHASISQKAWNFLCLCLFFLILGIALVMAWNQSLRQRVEKKTRRLKANETRLNELLAIGEMRTEKLRQTERNFMELINHHTNGILILQQKKVILCNSEMVAIFGKPVTFEISNFDGVPPEHLPHLITFCNAICEPANLPVSVSFQFNHPTAAAPRKWAHCRASSIRYMGSPSILVVAVDTTASEEMKNIVLIQDKMASLGRISAGIAHDIRSPLSGINIFLEQLPRYLPRNETSQVAYEIIDEIQAASSKIEAVIRRVMDFSKTGKPQCRPCLVNPTIQSTVKIVHRTLRKAGIRLELDLQEGVGPIMAEETHIQSLLFNLINNAKEAMVGQEREKVVTISTRQENDVLYFTVKDNGPGFSMDHREAIFEPFFSEKQSGTGIGLSICQRIVSDHGGTITATSQEGEGAAFVMAFPLLKKMGDI